MSPMTKHSLFLAVLILCGALPTDAEDAVTAAARELKTADSRIRAMIDLRRLAKAKDEDTACRALVILGPELYATPRELRPLVEPYRQPVAANFDYPRVSGFAEFCRLQAHDNASAASLLLLERAQSEAPAGLPQVLVDEAFGDVLQVPGHLQKALGHYHRALAYGKRFFRKPAADEGSHEAPRPLHASAWPRIRKRIRAKANDLARRLRIQAHGLDFVLYEEARIAQREGALQDAYDIYTYLIKKFPQSIYAEAARFYRCLCRTGDHAVRDRIRALQTFYKAQPQGLYRGETRLQLGLLWLTRKWNRRRARKEFAAAVRWCRETRQTDRAVALFTIPAKSRGVSAPPLDNQQRIRGIFIEPVAMEPGKLVNRQTARWYLNEIEKQARLGLVFCLFMEEEWDTARKVLDPILDLDSHLRWAQENEAVNTYFRLTLCCRYQKVDTNADELRRVPRKQRLQIQYAEFITLQRRFQEAQRCYEALLQQAIADEDEATQAVVSVALADLYQMQGKRKAGLALLRKVIRDFPRQRITARACYYLGNMIGGRLADPAGSRESILLYKRAMRLYPRSYLSRAARRAAAVRLAGLGHYEEAIAMAAKLGPDTKAMTMASVQSLYAAYKRRLARANAETNPADERKQDLQ